MMVKVSLCDYSWSNLFLNQHALIVCEMLLKIFIVGLTVGFENWIAT